MTLQEILDRISAVRSGLEHLAGLGDNAFTADDQRSWDYLNAELGWLVEQRNGLQTADSETRRARIEAVREAARDQTQRIPGDGARSAPLDADPIGEPESIRGAGRRDPWNVRSVDGLSVEEARSRAFDAIERMQGTTDQRRETATEMIERWDPKRGRNAGAISRHILLTSSPEYLRAFSKVVLGNELELTESERMVLARAMSLTDNAGGFMIPFQLDPTLILTSDGSVNPIRQLARKVVATGDVWNGFSTTHATWSYDAEASEASDDATTFAQPSIPIKKGVGFIPASEEAIADEPNITAVVGEIFAGGKDDLEATAFATGSGSGNNPTGIVTALTGGSSVVTSASTDTFAVADVYATEEALPARYRNRSAWTMHWKIANKIRQFGTADSHALFARLADGTPEKLLGHAWHEASAMDGTINATQDNYVLVIGDWSNFVIADRLGMTVQFIPHLFSTSNGRPTGQSGWRATVRHGSDSVNDGAFRMLNVT